MSQTGYTPLLIYGSTTASNVPLAANLTTSASGVELAINAADGKLFYKDSGGVVQVLATKGTGPIGGTNNQVQYNSSGSLAGSANLTFDGTTLTANALTTTSTVTINGGTANGVAYLNGSKVLTTGSTLTFDGTNLGVGGTSAGAKLSVNKGAAGVLLRLTDGSQQSMDISSNAGAGSAGVITTDMLNSGAQAWAIANTEQMRLTSTGLGIGTSSPSFRLHVSSSVANIATFNSSTDGYILITQSGAAQTLLGAVNTTGFVGTPTNHDFVFRTNNAERARIDTSGQFITKPATGGNSYSSGETGFYSDSGYGNLAIFGNTFGGGKGYIQFRYNTTVIGTVSSNGTTAVLYNTTSDYRLKTVIGAVSGHGERIDALEPIEYEWKSNGSRTRGFLAHKFQEVYAGSVNGEKDAVDAEGNPMYQSMQASSSEVIADLVAEIQSLRKRLAAAGL